MNLDFTEAEEAFRCEVRGWLEAQVPRPALPSGDTREGFALHRGWEERLFEARFAAVSWPDAYGGRGSSLVEWLIFEEEYYRAGAPQRISQNGIFLLAPTLFEFGTDEQKSRILPRMAAAKDLWAQGWSEPGAGSDSASIKSRAVRDEAGGGWRLTGQKAWCTRGAFCDWMFGLFRSDPKAERHKGLTYFLVPLRAPGVTVRGVGRLDGDEGFADVFLEDVFVPDRDVLGRVHEGWSVAMATTGSERGLTLRSPGRFLATAGRLIDLYRRYRSSEDPGLRNEVIQAWMDADAYRLFTLQTVTRLMDGASIGAESSLNKLFWSEMDVRMHETALRILGERAELVGGASEAVDEGSWMKGFQFALAGPIYAGTNEIQRNVVAERLLGLPQEMTMRFAFTDEQLLMRDTVRAFLDAHCPKERVRAAWQSNEDFNDLWTGLGQLGVLGLMVPEELGGLGLGELDVVMPLEETGRAALPAPLIETLVATSLLRDSVDEDRSRRLLSEISAGKVFVGLGLESSRFVVDAHRATMLLLQRGDSLFAILPDNVVLEAQPSADGARRLFKVSWNSKQAVLLLEGESARSAIARAFDLGALAAGAQLLGIAARLIAATVEHVNLREQFGRPIGSFQAVKHHLAEALLGLEFARPVVYRAAWSMERELPLRSFHVSLAKARASDAALLAARVALQCHGAIGYSFEHFLHLWMKRAWALAAAWGDSAFHKNRAGAAILDGPPHSQQLGEPDGSSVG